MTNTNLDLDLGEPSPAVKSLITKLEKGENFLTVLEADGGAEAVRRFCKSRKAAGAKSLTELFRKQRNACQ